MSIKGIDFHESAEVEIDFDVLNDESAKANIYNKITSNFIFINKRFMSIFHHL